MVIAVLAGMAVVTAASPLALAWESDVHYGLTRWLASTAGFSDEGALSVATGDLEADKGLADARKSVILSACIFKDEIASARTGELHFPTSFSVPNPPERRVVIAGGDPSQESVRKEISAPPPSSGMPQLASNRLTKFGQALHPLQDSWSHQGVPDSPGWFLCDRNYSWAHPKERGGWSEHFADQTYRWPEDSLATAKATYEAMLAFLKAQRWASAKNEVTWDKIEPDVRTFLSAGTKIEKINWFEEHGVRDIGFMKDVSIPDGAKLPFFDRMRSVELRGCPTGGSREINTERGAGA